MTGTQVGDGITELRTASVSVLRHLPLDTGWEIHRVSWAFSVCPWAASLTVTKTGPASLTHLGRSTSCGQARPPSWSQITGWSGRLAPRSGDKSGYKQALGLGIPTSPVGSSVTSGSLFNLSFLVYRTGIMTITTLQGVHKDWIRLRKEFRP